jgi:pyruvate kinase
MAETMSSQQLLASLLVVRGAAATHEERLAPVLDDLAPDERLSATNLLHYLAVRQFDLRPEQRALSQRGLTSLGRSEAHVLATLDAAIVRLAADVGRVDLPVDLGLRGPSATIGDDLLARRASRAFGPAAPGHSTRVMVTLPSEAATDPASVVELVRAGMAIARINTAHDDEAAWLAMVANVRDAARLCGRSVRVAVDLAGPKLRVGRLPAGPRVIRARPDRDDLGVVDVPVRVRFVRADRIEPGSVGPLDAARGEAVSVPVDPTVVAAAAVGDVITLVDARGRSRWFAVVAVFGDAIEATSDRTTYLTPDVRVERRRDGEVVAAGNVAGVPARPGVVRVRRGDIVRIKLGSAVGSDAVRHDDGSIRTPCTVTVDVPALFASVREGHRVLVDDGRVEGVVVAVSRDTVDVEVLHPASAKIREDKGINLPDTPLTLPAMDATDLATLASMAPVVDLIALSYVSDVGDVDAVHGALEQLGADHVGVILKIEHRPAFEALPRLLLRGLRRPPVAVMIARGDLAVEVGFERLAEVQEEILWFTEAAHIPVIWATQVLESMAKTGSPTRSEVTDAAWASRSECVMLNKGPYVADAIRFLDDVLTRMDGHGAKRTPMLRRLAVAEALGPMFDRPLSAARPIGR